MNVGDLVSIVGVSDDLDDSKPALDLVRESKQALLGAIGEIELVYTGKTKGGHVYKVLGHYFKADELQQAFVKP